MKVNGLTYLAFEIGGLFIAGGLFYLFQRRKYLKQHETITQSFIQRVKSIDPSFLESDSKRFELNFIEKYKREKNLNSYSHELQEVYSEYIDYIEGISGPIL